MTHHSKLRDTATLSAGSIPRTDSQQSNSRDEEHAASNRRQRDGLSLVVLDLQWPKVNHFLLPRERDAPVGQRNYAEHDQHKANNALQGSSSGVNSAPSYTSCKLTASRLCMGGAERGAQQRTV